MAVVSGPKPSIPRPTGWQIPGSLARHVGLDPGIAYVFADALMFWGTNPVGMVAMAGAVCVAAAMKTVTVLQPSFATKYPRIMELAKDDRVPLRAGGLAMLLVTGATIAMGAWIPAAASFFFAIANFGLANSISKQHIADERKHAHDHDHKPLSKGEEIKTLFKRPDIYLNIGFALAGLMAGGAAMAIVPVVAGAFAIGMKNTFAGKPEYEGHPKLITATAAALFAGIGFMNGHGLIAAAHLVNAIVLGEMERRMTPGGLGQIMKDIGSGVGRLFGSKPVKPAPQPQSRPQPEHANDRYIPAPEVPAADLAKVDLQEAFKIRTKPQAQPEPQPSFVAAPALTPAAAL